MITRRKFLASAGVIAPIACLGQTPFSLSDQAFLNNALVYPLDLGITFTGAWGMAPLSRASTDLFILRRVSDSTEQTFGRVGRGPNYPSIATFLASTTGKVKTLIDQSGGGNNATQTTVAEQPRYTVVLGRATSYFIDTGTRFLLPTAPNMVGRNFSKYYVFATLDRTFSNVATWPIMMPMDRADTSGSFATNETRSTSMKADLSWGTSPKSGVIVPGNCSVNVFVLRSNASNTHWRLNEISADSATLASTSTIACTEIGRGAGGSRWVSGCMMAALYGPAHTASEEERVIRSLQLLFSTKPKTKAVFFDGDSITAGHKEGVNFDERDESWPYELLNSIGDPSVNGNNRAFSAAQIVDGTGDPNKDLTVWAPTKLDAYLSSVYSKKVLVVMAGTNDINVIGAAGAGLTTYDRLVAYCQARRTAGWSRIVVVNCIPRLDFVATVKEDERLDYNARIAANANTDWDATIDAASLAWVPGGVWTVNYQGATGLHPNAAGRTLLVNAVKSTLQSYL